MNSKLIKTIKKNVKRNIDKIKKSLITETRACPIDEQCNVVQGIDDLESTKVINMTSISEDDSIKNNIKHVFTGLFLNKNLDVHSVTVCGLLNNDKDQIRHILDYVKYCHNGFELLNLSSNNFSADNMIYILNEINKKKLYIYKLSLYDNQECHKDNKFLSILYDLIKNKRVMKLRLPYIKCIDDNAGAVHNFIKEKNTNFHLKLQEESNELHGAMNMYQRNVISFKCQ